MQNKHKKLECCKICLGSSGICDYYLGLYGDGVYCDLAMKLLNDSITSKESLEETYRKVDDYPYNRGFHD